VLQEAKNGHDGHVIPVQNCNNIGGDTLSSLMPLQDCLSCGGHYFLATEAFVEHWQNELYHEGLWVNLTVKTS